MAQRQLRKHGGQLLLGIVGQKLVDRRQMLVFQTPACFLIHEEYQRLQKIAFAVVPEMVAFAFAGVADDNVGQHLRHHRVAVQVGHAVP